MTPDGVSANHYHLSTVEHDGCKWVLCHNGYGSDMEHHPACQNPEYISLKCLLMLDPAQRNNLSRQGMSPGDIRRFEDALRQEEQRGMPPNDDYYRIPLYKYIGWFLLTICAAVWLFDVPTPYIRIPPFEMPGPLEGYVLLWGLFFLFCGRSPIKMLAFTIFLNAGILFYDASFGPSESAGWDNIQTATWVHIALLAIIFAIGKKLVIRVKD